VTITIVSPTPAPGNAALDYAQRGLPVIPLHTLVDGLCTCRKKQNCGKSAGKHPRTLHGLKDASTNEEQIREWWNKWPDANVGIATGPESGVFMLGPDGQAGIEALAELEGQHERLPRTPRARSGGGGQHYVFAWPKDGHIKSGANYNGLPIDVRGQGGLFVAAPSLHWTSNRYQWEISLDQAPIAPAPAWLLDWIRNGKGTTSKHKKKPTKTAPCNREDREDGDDGADGDNGADGEDGDNGADGEDGDNGADRESLVSSLSSAPSLLQAVEPAIVATLPTAQGQRRRCIFQFARHLKAIPSLATADFQTLRPLLREWHKRALPVIGTKPFVESWADFVQAWDRVRFPIGQGPIAEAFQRATTSKPPAKAVDLYSDEPRIQLLAALCCELQRIVGDGDFYLDVRSAGRLIGIHHTTAWRWLKVLCADGLLAAGAKGSKATGKASRYRFIVP
jgi:hypothetical protein